MASEVEVNVVPPHDRQDLLPGRRDPTVAPARVAREVAEDNLPGILPRLGELAVQQLFLGFGVVDVVVDGDGVHRSKHDRGCLQRITGYKKHEELDQVNSANLLFKL